MTRLLDAEPGQMRTIQGRTCPEYWEAGGRTPGMKFDTVSNMLGIIPALREAAVGP